MSLSVQYRVECVLDFTGKLWFSIYVSHLLLYDSIYQKKCIVSSFLMPDPQYVNTDMECGLVVPWFSWKICVASIENIYSELIWRSFQKLVHSFHFQEKYIVYCYVMPSPQLKIWLLYWSIVTHFLWVIAFYCLYQRRLRHTDQWLIDSTDES